MSLQHSPKIVTDGLVLALDTGNSKSYPGSGASIINLVDNTPQTLNGTYSYANGQIRLTNTSGTATSNTSYLKLTTLSNIRTVSIWYYQHSALSIARYLLDTRAGAATGYVYGTASGANDIGAIWSSGILYVNAIANPMLWSNIESVGTWQNVTLIANSSATDDMNVFSNSSNNEALDVTFTQVSVYNRVLSSQEVLQNFNATRGRFGI